MVVPLTARSASKIASMRLTASAAIGEMTGTPRPRFSCAATSASSKNFRLPCAQHSARVSDTGDRLGRNKAL